MTLPDDAADVFQQHRNELGFVNRAQCEEKDLLTTQRDGEVVAALLGNHCVRKDQSTVYELAVLPEYRRSGLARTLVRRFMSESPHDKLIAKCPIELPAMQFYNQTGWNLQAVESGKNKPLAVWRYMDGE